MGRVSSSGIGLSRVSRSVPITVCISCEVGWPRTPITLRDRSVNARPGCKENRLARGRFRPPLRPARSRLRAPESLGGISTYSRSAPGGSRSLSAPRAGAQAAGETKTALVANRRLEPGTTGYDRRR
jgi:hypothetical protein